MIDTYVNTAVRVLAGNEDLETAANWIDKHKNKPEVDQVHLVIMGKKVKKRGKSDSREERSPSTTETASHKGTSNADSSTVEVSSCKDRGKCPHIERGITVDKLSEKLGSSVSLTCEDCRGNIGDRRAKKGKGTNGKRGGINSNSDSRSIWICLNCSQFSCGGVGLPTTPQSHAVRHAKQNRHPLVVHYENHQLVWCFPCNKLIHAKKSEETKNKDVLNDVVRILKGHAVEESSLDVEDVWFGSSSLTIAVKCDSSGSISSDGKAGYSVRGLINLGNTCFFNSIMQNLLAISKLRDYFFQLEEPAGPLTAALKKFFLETRTGSGLRGAIDPKSLLGSLCIKAPQFKGYDQHDSHELLRCLLDSLSAEELSFRKQTKCLQASISDPIFVDATFGGQLSSTVCCLECGHPSTVYEPFLDLSLPVPTKKPPLRRIQNLMRGKKPKVPPKKGGRNFSKISRAICTVPGASFSDRSIGGSSVPEVQSVSQPEHHLFLSVGDCPSSDSICPNNVALDMGLTVNDLSASDNSQNNQAAESVGDQSMTSDSFTWLNFVEPNTASHEKNEGGVEDLSKHSFSYTSTWLDYLDLNPLSPEIRVTAKADEISAIQDMIDRSVTENDFLKGNSVNPILESSVDHITSYNVPGRGDSSPEHAFPQFEDKQNSNAEFSERPFPGDSITEEVAHCHTDVGHSSSLCNQVIPEDVNFPAQDTINLEQSSYSKVQDAEITSHLHKDVSSSAEVLSAEIEMLPAVHGSEKDSFDVSGFGDLFNEPEGSLENQPSERPVFEGSSITRNGVAGNSSESDPGEVDNDDAPVSVESCLACFVKPELLSKDEHAWQCDNCSKRLQEQITRSRKKFEIPTSDFLPNGTGDRNPSSLLDAYKANSQLSVTGNLKKDDVDPSAVSSLPHSRDIYGKGKLLLGGHAETGTDETNFQTESIRPHILTAFHGPSECSSSSSQVIYPSRKECGCGEDALAGSQILSIKRELEVCDQEALNSDDMKVKRDATKSILINKAPPILTIHLKRFSQDARGRLSKLNGHVNFRERIDLGPYMNPRCSEKDISTYRLVGVVEHSGTMRGGHYIAYVRGVKSNGECAWYYVSDSHIREVSLAEVLHCEAYILFYEAIID